MDRPLAKPRLALVALVLLAALATATAASVSGAATGSAVKKCTNGRVLVKVNKKPSCKPLRSVLPRPKAGDRRLIHLRAALKLDVTQLENRRGKHARPLPARAKKARKKFLRALPKAIRILDGLGEGASASHRRRAGPAASNGACGGTAMESETGRSGEAAIRATKGSNGEEGIVMTLPLGGLTYEVRFTQCGNPYYYVLGCPKANGDAASSAGGRYDVTERWLDGKRVVRQSSTSTTYKDKLLGKVQDDARLNYFDLTRQEQSLTVATGGFVQQVTATRTIRVKMPSGSYDAAHSRVNIVGDANAIKKDDLAASIEMATKEYREAENGGSFLHTDGWATFERKRDPYCAKAVFSPASNAVEVRKGQSYHASVYAKGTDGGRATGARWTLLDSSNALFPGSLSGANPSIDYSVRPNPAGTHVRVTAKFTSTAGVGRDTWTQPIAGLPTINHLTGTFSGSYTVSTLAGNSIVSWTGNARYDRASPGIFGGASGLYSLVSGGYDMTASGVDGSLASACQQMGTKHFNLGGPGSGDFQVESTALSSFDPPYDYLISAIPLGPQTMDITRHSCPPGAAALEGTSGVTIFFPPALDTGTTPYVSDDGIVYRGSRNESAGGVTVNQSWDFDGTE